MVIQNKHKRPRCIEVSFSPRVTSTRVKFKFDPLHHICVFMSNLHFMSYINVCLYATDLDLYLKVFTERDKNCVDFMQIRQFIERIFTFMYTCQGCAQCFLCWPIHNVLIMILLEKKKHKIIICDWRRVSKTIVL